MTKPRVDEDVDQLELPFIASGNAKWYSHPTKWSALSHKDKPVIIT